MNIELTKNSDQIELIKAMGSTNKVTSQNAQEAFADFVGPVVQRVLAQAATAGMIYTDMPYNEDDSPTFPLDLYYGTNVDNVQVWSQTYPGGLASSHVSGLQELTFTTYRLDSAVNILKKYARRSRLDVVSAAVTRLAQELLVKQERNAWIVALRCLAEGSTNGNAHVINAGTANVLQIDDLNALKIRSRRINVSFANGTPDNRFSEGITDLFISPERMGDVRGFCYQPMNTRIGATGTAGTPAGSSTAVPLPDEIRTEIYRSGGAPSIFDVSLHEMNELGDAQKYNALFAQFYTGSFTAATDDLVVGVDVSRGAFKRAIAQNADTGSTIVVQPDDQWASRSEKLGWYANLTEGRVAIDARAILGLRV